VSAAVRVLPTVEAVGDDIAAGLLARIESARESGRRFLLGCPTGRTPKPVFAAMARRLAHAQQDLSHVVLLMMDEYLVETTRGMEYAPASEPWSCHYFARVEIAERLNAGLSPERQITANSTWFPDPRDPDGYEKRIKEAGGIDFFILASGASDGHVAFNQPGSARDSRTRIIPLSEQTRRDNLSTFPVFGSLDNVPQHGVSVGIATIVESREAVMIVLGAGKRETLSRMRSADRYQSDWPATLIHECASAEIVADAAAAQDPDPRAS
jgi:glucosamine-6-phosphate deaminase